ncbi:MAG: hypothetical protein NBKEAIPA_02594 [Nitrospirae bacterium]|nr:MAG: putative glycosyltransferase [Nitrospira sp. OLB3]MBV6470671.1 hypothetical protein [Nitrospirota bacterium]MCK6492354.1 glycosyltransferase family 4 protein [Nitrospira sp.]MEB2338077.1 glycosyltransferase family 4 protein [Nitrospirales bacterium]QOJ36286.1 MAG: glycosyltransferase family 4 protein [Nitrospira sp.]
MTVTYFSKTSSIGPSSRYRIFQYLPQLRGEGIQCVVHPLFGEAYFAILKVPSRLSRILLKISYVPRRFARRCRQLVSLRRNDLIVIEGQLFPYLPPVAERILKWCRYRLAVEMDDAIYLTVGHHRKMPALLALADAVIVGNERLAAYARRYSPEVHVVPTVVDTERFIPRVDEPDGESGDSSKAITVVWIGLAYNLWYLDVLAPALRALQAHYPIRLRVVCSQPPQLPGIDVEFRPWDLQREVVDLQDASIGVMPLRDTEWARGKCGLKLLQYMAVGIPAVASPVGVNREIITNGKNGFLASTEREWHNCLEMLCRSPQLRRQMGQAGRRTVVDQYSLSLWGPRLAALYRTVSANGRGGGWAGRKMTSPGSMTRFP